MSAWMNILGRVAATIWSILALPLRLCWIFIAGIFNVFLILATPGIIVGSFILSWIMFIVDFFLSLEPLYTFVACGAFVGVLAGVCVGLTSGFLTSIFGMQEQPKLEPSDDYYYESTIPTPGSSSPTRRSSRADDSSSFDEWMLLEKMPRSRRKRTAGLLSQTILEETDPEIEF